MNEITFSNYKFFYIVLLLNLCFESSAKNQMNDFTFSLDTIIQPLVEIGERSTIPIEKRNQTGINETLINLDVIATGLKNTLPANIRNDIKVYYFAMNPSLSSLKLGENGHTLPFLEMEKIVKSQASFYLLLGTKVSTDGKMKFEASFQLPDDPFFLNKISNSGEPLIGSSLKTNSGSRTNLLDDATTDAFENKYTKYAESYFQKENSLKIGESEGEGLKKITQDFTGNENIGLCFLDPSGHVLIKDKSSVKNYYWDYNQKPNTGYIEGFVSTEDKYYKAIYQGTKFMGYQEYNNATAWYPDSKLFYLENNQSCKLELRYPFVKNCRSSYYYKEGFTYTNNETKLTTFDHTNGYEIKKAPNFSGNPEFATHKGCTVTTPTTPSTPLYVFGLTPGEKNIISEELEAYLNIDEIKKTTNSLTGKNFATNVVLFVSKGDTETDYKELLKIPIKQNEIIIWYVYVPNNNTMEEKFVLQSIRFWQLKANIDDKIKDLTTQANAAIKNYTELQRAVNDAMWKITKETAKLPFRVVYEAADLLSKGTAYLKIPKYIYDCKDPQYNALLAKAIAYSPMFITLQLVPNSLKPEQLQGTDFSEGAPFAFTCGLWNGTVEIVKGAADLVGGIANTVVTEGDNISKGFKKFGDMEIVGKCSSGGNYWCKVGALASSAWDEETANVCRSAHLAGSIVGPIVALCLGNAEAITGISAEASSYLIRVLNFLKICDKIGDPFSVLGYAFKMTKIGTAPLRGALYKGATKVAEFIGDKAKLTNFQLLNIDGTIAHTIDNVEINASEMDDIMTKGCNGEKIIVDGKEGYLKVPACFVAGTKVHTRNKGLINIDDLTQNDEVKSFDTKTQTTTFAKVLATYARSVNRLFKVIVGKDTITTTMEHPFYVVGAPEMLASEYFLLSTKAVANGQWLPTSTLKKGMLLLLASGVLAPIDTVYGYEQIAKVYNLEVANQHNYYVGNSGVLVHNGNCALEAMKLFLESKSYDKNVIDNLINDIKNLPNMESIASKITNGEISIEAWQIMKKHSQNIGQSEDLMASITARAKKNSDLKLFDDLEDPDIFQAYSSIRDNPTDAWDIYGELKEILGSKNPPQKTPETLLSYAQSKHVLNNGPAGRNFENAITGLLTTQDAALRNAISSRLQKMGYNIKLSDYTFVKNLKIYLGKKADGSPLYCDIDCAYVRDKNGNGLDFEVIPIDAKHSIDAPATTNQKIWLEQLGSTRNFKTHLNNGSYDKLLNQSNIEIKTALRIDGPIGNYQVNQFVKK